MLSRLAALLLGCACVLPASSQSVVANIPLSGSPQGIAVNPHNNRIYVALSTAQLDVIDGSSNSVVATVSIPSSAQFVAVNLVTDRVYVTGCTFNPENCAVTVLDGNSNAIVATVPIAGPNGIGAQGIAVNPVTNRIFVSDDQNFELEIIDGNTNQTSYLYTHNTEALGLAVDFVTNQILVTPSGGGLDVVNGTNGTIQFIKVGSINQDTAVNSFTGRAYVTNNAGTTVGVIDLNTMKVITNIDVAATPYSIAADYLSNLIFVTLENQTVAAINGTTNNILGTVNVNANYIDVNPATRLVYASDSTGNMVHVISE